MVPLTLLSLLFFAQVVIVVSGEEARCKRQSSEKATSPKFICFADVVVRQHPTRECDTIVSETYLLPHTSDFDFTRYLLLADEHLNVTDVRTALRGNASRHAMKTVNERHEIHVPTVANPRPGNVTISYVVRNGVGRVSKMSPCPAARLNHSVLLWGFAKWNQHVDVLHVRLQSAKDELNIQGSVSNATFVNATTADIVAQDVDGTFLASGFMRHVSECPVVLACARGGGVTLTEPPKLSFFEVNKSVLIGVGSAAIAFITVCCFLFRNSIKPTNTRWRARHFGAMVSSGGQVGSC